MTTTPTPVPAFPVFHVLFESLCSLLMRRCLRRTIL
jgi:hypothetical protein